MSKTFYSSIKRRFAEPVLKLLQRSTYAPMPRSINLDITWSCNLACTMCSAHQTVNKQGPQHLSRDRFRHILNQLPRLRHIYFMGLGEPLMNPHLPELLDDAQSKNIHASLITNGMLLHENNIRRFTDNLISVSVSIDTASANTFNRIRKGASLSKILENIRTLRKLRPLIDLTFLVVLMKETIDDLPGVVELAHELGASTVNVNHIIALDEATDNRRTTSLTAGAMNSLIQAEETAKGHGIDFSSRPLEPQTRHCWQPWTAPLIMANGDILPCCFMDRSPHPESGEWYSGVSIDVPFSQYRAGNIFEDTFSTVWNGTAFRRIRKTIGRAEGNESLTSSELNRRRFRFDKEEAHAYCRICLFRWNCAC